jgi:hypothetical protein
MERRDVLERAGALATVSIAGLAGCSGDSAGGDNTPDPTSDGSTPESDGAGSACGTPEGDLTGAFPDSESYQQQDSQVNEESSQEGMVSSAFAAYTDSADDRYSLRVFEYENPETATTESEKAADQSNSDTGVIGYIVAEEFAYVGFGPDEASLIEFMETSSLLAECVEANITFV